MRLTAYLDQLRAYGTSRGTSIGDQERGKKGGGLNKVSLNRKYPGAPRQFRQAHAFLQRQGFKHQPVRTGGRGRMVHSYTHSAGHRVLMGTKGWRVHSPSGGRMGQGSFQHGGVTKMRAFLRMKGLLGR